jgi:site-specific DNA-cytosine methylase
VNLELFPCSGGMAEGFRRAGITFDLSIDYSSDACDSYERNLGHRPLHMDVNDFARMLRAGWRPPAPDNPWYRVSKEDARCRALADKHYSRQTIGHPMWTRPGYNFVLRAEVEGGEAVFCWWRPKWEAGIERKDKMRALECTIFRNESRRLSSELIRRAVDALWTPAARDDLSLDRPGDLLLITGVDADATADRRSSRSSPGECFLRAGWTPIEKTTKRADTWLGVNARHPSSVDLFVADPPCTPWSRAGDRKGLEDERDCLRVTAEIIAMLRPRAYLIGNVPGLQDATQWKIVQTVIGGLSKQGYCVRDYASLDAADYGVPQNRVRPFWFGHLDGPCVRWPERTHASAVRAATMAIPGTRQLLSWVTCRQALSHLSLEELGRPVRMRLRKKGEAGNRSGGDDVRCSKPDEPANTVVARQHRKGGQILIPGVGPSEKRARYIPNGGDESVCSSPDAPARVVVAHEGVKGGGILLANENHAPSEMDSPAKTVTGGRANRGVQGGRALRIDGGAHPPARPDEPAKTIRSGGDGHSAPQVVLAIDEVVEHPRHPVSRVDEPAFVVKTNGGRASGAGSILKVGDLERDPSRGAHCTSPDEPAKTITRNTHSEGATLVFDERALGEGQGSRVGSADEPSSTVDAAGRGQHGLLEWPWDRPATTVTSRDSLGAPGHHDPAIRGYSGQYGPNAVVLSEKAAAILQGFPDGWLFSGDTKAARWAQIGMAMPPGLAAPVAGAIVEQMLVGTKVEGGGLKRPRSRRSLSGGGGRA